MKNSRLACLAGSLGDTPVTCPSRGPAFANVLAFAASQDEFAQIARRAFDGLGFEVIDVETPEPLRTRLNHATVDEELLRLAHDLESDGRPRVGTFHTWRSES